MLRSSSIQGKVKYVEKAFSLIGENEYPIINHYNLGSCATCGQIVSADGREPERKLGEEERQKERKKSIIFEKKHFFFKKKVGNSVC